MPRSVRLLPGWHSEKPVLRSFLAELHCISGRRSARSLKSWIGCLMRWENPCTGLTKYCRRTQKSLSAGPVPGFLIALAGQKATGVQGYHPAGPDPDMGASIGDNFPQFARGIGRNGNVFRLSGDPSKPYFSGGDNRLKVRALIFLLKPLFRRYSGAVRRRFYRRKDNLVECV